VLTTDTVQASDVVVMIGGGDACPFFPASGTRTGSATDLSKLVQTAGPTAVVQALA
jgi:hypothetical protein